ADWQAGGLHVPADLAGQLHDASRGFSHAVTEPDRERARRGAQATLAQAVSAAEAMTHLYVEQVFQMRHQRDARLPSALGCRLTHPIGDPVASDLLAACNTVTIPFPWRAIEPGESAYHWQEQDAILDWAERHELAVSGGPIIDFTA